MQKLRQAVRKMHELRVNEVELVDLASKESAWHGVEGHSLHELCGGHSASERAVFGLEGIQTGVQKGVQKSRQAAVIKRSILRSMKGTTIPMLLACWATTGQMSLPPTALVNVSINSTACSIVTTWCGLADCVHSLLAKAMRTGGEEGKGCATCLQHQGQRASIPCCIACSL